MEMKKDGMLSFTKVGLKDMEILRPWFAAAGERSSDCTAGAAVMWRDFFQTEYALHGASLILRYQLQDGGTSFNMPLGGDTAAALREIEAYCGAGGVPMRLCCVTEKDLALPRALYPVEASSNGDWSDYLYLAEDLRTFSGRRYNGQRNHVNAFKRAYPDYRLEEARPEDMEELRSFYTHSGRVDCKDSLYFREEQKIVFDVLERYEDYSALGGILRAGGGVVAFSMGEVVGDTLFVHIEKADFKCRGAYQVMVQEFARRFAGPGVVYVNREEDCGDEGLRRSKQSYHPCQMIRKYTVQVNA
jgi:hypothetical protein